MLLKKWGIGILLILAVYSLYYIYFYDTLYYYTIDRKLKHIIKFITLVAVFFIGWLYTKQAKQAWLKQMWLLIYFCCFCVLIAIGLYDWIFKEASYQVQSFSHTIFEFLISPIPYIGLFLFQKIIPKRLEEN
ncbi:MAG: hypothetical protein ACOVNY_08295 [Chitinophagaceae bacterium]